MLVGNVRVAYYRDAYNSVIADRETNYYPFGLEYPFSWVWSQQYNYRYGFQGQEKQIETGWSSFKWRNSIPELGRFFNVDPLSEDYHDWSVYAFSGNRVVDSRELEGLEPKKVTEVSLPDDPMEFGEMIGGGINSVRSSVSNLSARAYNVLFSDRIRNKYEVDQNGYLNLVTGVPRETRREKIVNTIGDLATIGMAAAGGPEGMLTAQGGKASILRTFEEVKTTLKATNGNSKSSTKAQHLYEIFRKSNGDVIKTGVSGGKISKSGKSYRATSQVNRINKKAGKKIVDSRVIKKEPAGPNARKNILEAEVANAEKNRATLDPNYHKRP
ncbi:MULTISPECIES: RHS repeat-associated core domain-containing protein [Chryseobacterium]|uniref:RHS repeat-associated core domain-containing protein n=1 Tax=Chryseobacterium TaxID=59732 RepID=UPI00359371A6